MMSPISFIGNLNLPNALSKIANYKVASVEKIPVRATLCSALFSVPYVMGLLVPAPNAENYLERGKSMRTVLTFILLFRCQCHKYI